MRETVTVYYGSHNGIDWLECLTSSKAESYRHWRVESHPNPSVDWEAKYKDSQETVVKLNNKLERISEIIGW